MSERFEKLQAWQKAKELVLLIYQATDQYPPREQFALTSQTTRAAVSVIANIAEGSSRSSKKDFAHFLEISIGSAFELETLLIIARERDYLDNQRYSIIQEVLQSTIKLNFGLLRSIKK